MVPSKTTKLSFTNKLIVSSAAALTGLAGLNFYQLFNDEEIDDQNVTKLAEFADRAEGINGINYTKIQDVGFQIQTFGIAYKSQNSLYVVPTLKLDNDKICVELRLQITENIRSNLDERTSISTNLMWNRKPTAVRIALVFDHSSIINSDLVNVNSETGKVDATPKLDAIFKTLSDRFQKAALSQIAFQAPASLAR